MEEKRCILCNKPYNYKYAMFGRGCLDNLYEVLNFSKSPKFVWNKEMYLCTKIAWKNHKFFLNRKKKYILAQKYIALNYLNKMNYETLNDIKEKVSKDINNITTFSKNTVELMSFSLNDIYKLYNNYQKFEKVINDFQNINWEEIDKKTAEDFIKSISFIFDITKKSNPISYAVFYSMQYVFWQIVVIGKEPSDMLIEGDEIKKTLLKSETFKNKLKQLIEKYGEERKEFIVDENSLAEDISIRFDDADLLYALHKATLAVKATKDENDKWNLEIEIKDTYDFTEFKGLMEYADSENVITDIFSTLLNNFGVISSEYGVIKVYAVKIKFETKEGEF